MNKHEPIGESPFSPDLEVSFLDLEEIKPRYDEAKAKARRILKRFACEAKSNDVLNVVRTLSKRIRSPDAADTVLVAGDILCDDDLARALDNILRARPRLSLAARAATEALADSLRKSSPRWAHMASFPDRESHDTASACYRDVHQAVRRAKRGSR